MSILNSLMSVFRTKNENIRSGRRSARFSVSTPARLRPADEAGSWEQVTLDNLSLGGARVRTNTRLTLKSKVDLLINLRGNAHMDLRARVVYVRADAKGFQTECGLRFIELSYDQYQALISYMNEREQTLRSGLQHPRKSQPA
jgi:c-di-GMP-binding flagellar brake protein YcgR